MKKIINEYIKMTATEAVAVVDAIEALVVVLANEAVTI